MDWNQFGQGWLCEHGRPSADHLVGSVLRLIAGLVDRPRLDIEFQGIWGPTINDKGEAAELIIDVNRRQAPRHFCRVDTQHRTVRSSGMIVVAHEFGHEVDALLHGGKPYAGGPALAKWWAAVEGSTVHKWLRLGATQQVYPVRKGDGLVLSALASTDVACCRKMILPEEAFARSWAQLLAWAGDRYRLPGDESAAYRKQFDDRQSTQWISFQSGAVVLFDSWTSHQFDPIARALVDALQDRFQIWKGGPI